MNLLSWNCRELCNPRTVRDLHQLVKEKRPSIVFLMETLVSQSYMERICKRLQFDNIFVVNPTGRSGGLALLWLNDYNIEIFNFSKSHINVLIKDVGGIEKWKSTGFYGQPDTAKRRESWALLKHLSLLQPILWLCVGDFNEILEQRGKKGSKIRSEPQMNRFRCCLKDCGLGDLGYIGPNYTWNNGRGGADFIQERLDRALANCGWCSIFPHVTVTVLATSRSDHNPVSVLFQKCKR